MKCNVMLKVTTVKGLGVFWKILFRWKASVYKSVWYNLLLYILLYSSLSITYRYFLSEEQRVDTYILVICGLIEQILFL